MVAGGAAESCDGVQVSRGVRKLYDEDLLEDATTLPHDRRRLDAQVLESTTGRGAALTTGAVAVDPPPPRHPRRQRRPQAVGPRVPRVIAQLL